jgi:hypothetical protein
MITKSMRQSSRAATDIHRQFGRTGRAIKITPNKYEKVTKKRNWLQKIVDKVKSLLGR